MKIGVTKLEEEKELYCLGGGVVWRLLLASWEPWGYNMGEGQGGETGGGAEGRGRGR